MAKGADVSGYQTHLRPIRYHVRSHASTNTNYSNNHGIEGVITDSACLDDPKLSHSIQTARYNAQKALLATLLLSHGTPMLLSGDELGHSQQGNNNAYCQDNEITWIDWEHADFELYKYVSKIIRLLPKVQQ